MMKFFCKNIKFLLKKSFIIDVCLGFKYASAFNCFYLLIHNICCYIFYHYAPTRIVLMSQITHLNTVNHVYSRTIASLKSRYLPAFLKPEYGKKSHKRQYGSIHIVLSQNFHQYSKDIQSDPYCPLKDSV